MWTAAQINIEVVLNKVLYFGKEWSLSVSQLDISSNIKYNPNDTNNIRIYIEYNRNNWLKNVVISFLLFFFFKYIILNTITIDIIKISINEYKSYFIITRLHLVLLSWSVYGSSCCWFENLLQSKFVRKLFGWVHLWFSGHKVRCNAPMVVFVIPLDYF